MNVNQENTLLRMILERNEVILQLHATIEKLNKVLSEKSAKEDAATNDVAEDKN